LVFGLHEFDFLLLADIHDIISISKVYSGVFAIIISIFCVLSVDIPAEIIGELLCSKTFLEGLMIKPNENLTYLVKRAAKTIRSINSYLEDVKNGRATNSVKIFNGKKNLLLVAEVLTMFERIIPTAVVIQNGDLLELYPDGSSARNILLKAYRRLESIYAAHVHLSFDVNTVYDSKAMQDALSNVAERNAFFYGELQEGGQDPLQTKMLEQLMDLGRIASMNSNPPREAEFEIINAPQQKLTEQNLKEWILAFNFTISFETPVENVHEIPKLLNHALLYEAGKLTNDNKHIAFIHLETTCGILIGGYMRVDTAKNYVWFDLQCQLREATDWIKTYIIQRIVPDMDL